MRISRRARETWIAECPGDVFSYLWTFLLLSARLHIYTAVSTVSPIFTISCDVHAVHAHRRDVRYVCSFWGRFVWDSGTGVCFIFLSLRYIMTAKPLLSFQASPTRRFLPIFTYFYPPIKIAPLRDRVIYLCRLTSIV